MASYRHVDIALDTFPYGGTTTTCEALIMGVPVVTLSGQTHASRVGTSLVSAIGHPEWSARSADGFVAAAGLLARDVARVRSDRPALRTQVRASVLCDWRGHAARFGAILGTLRAHLP